MILSYKTNNVHTCNLLSINIEQVEIIKVVGVHPFIYMSGASIMLCQDACLN